MKKLKILHVYKDYFPPVIGGVERNIHDICEGLKEFFDFKVLTANTCFKTEESVVGNIPVIKARSFGRIASAPLCPDYPRIIASEKADIYHFHCPNPTGDISYLLKRPPGKVIATYHSDVVRQKWAMSVYGRYLRKFLNLCDVIMPTSPNYIESSVYLRPVKDKCRVVPLGIDTAKYIRTEVFEKNAQFIKERFTKPIILFVGRLRQYKGLPYLIRAMRDVDAVCILIGSGPMDKDLTALTKKLKLEERVYFKGSVSEEELVTYYHAADIFCLPSHLRSEAYGLCQIEAMASGLPVISTDLDTGVPYVNQNQKTGLIVPKANPKALSSAINLLLKNENLRKELGKNALVRAQTELDIKNMLEKVKKIYESLI